MCGKKAIKKTVEVDLMLTRLSKPLKAESYNIDSLPAHPPKNWRLLYLKNPLSYKWKRNEYARQSGINLSGHHNYFIRSLLGYFLSIF
jgi:hypothetical protein